jgi:predicted DNA-binding mobile mystery protein A
MVKHYEQLDQHLAKLRPLANTPRPARGWVRAIRNTLGMTTRQLAARMGVSQPRIVMLEKAEVDRSITLESLERAAEALGCRVVYALVPEKPLGETLNERASQIADQQLVSIDQTMKLESQGVTNSRVRNELRKGLAEKLLRRPARLWDKI